MSAANAEKKMRHSTMIDIPNEIREKEGVEKGGGGTVIRCVTTY